MRLPSNYNWLLEIGQLPRVIDFGLRELGVRETPGPGDNPVIMGWADEVGVPTIGYRYTADAVPWCGLYQAVIAKRAGKKIPTGPLYALNWINVGTPVANRQGYSVSNPLVFLPGMRASLGDDLIFRRPGGGHVGRYIGESVDAYCVLGGNQGGETVDGALKADAVTFAWIAKSRCVAIRRPHYNTPPVSVRPFILSRPGALSTNEA